MSKPPHIWSLINKRSDTETTQLCKQFNSVEPFPHLIVDNFFSDAFIKRLQEEFPVRGQEDYLRFCRQDGGEIGTNYANGDVNAFPPAYKELDALVASKEFRDMVSAITGIPDLEYDPDYFGGGIRESIDGFLPPHLDFNYHPKTKSHRRLNLLFYFNDDWKEEWGGNLQVHKDPKVHKKDSLVHSYLPARNRCLAFETSEISWHGFDRLNVPEGRARRAFTIYYYTKTRPNAEKIKLHNTEYVEPPLPSHLQPGYQLTAQDVAFLEESFVRRDDRIRMLYELRAEHDGKMAHVWSEYEYYLALSQRLAAEKGQSLGGGALGRLKRAFQALTQPG
jgi:Rps23 Pro-64 3,4-dihydroxylase Tpa1-like proline 4-hydroxylase